MHEASPASRLGWPGNLVPGPLPVTGSRVGTAGTATAMRSGTEVGDLGQWPTGLDLFDLAASC